MDIKDFVSETLVQIDEALESAAEKTGKGYMVSNGVKGGKGVAFNLAVTNSEASESGKDKKGGIRIKVLEASLESGGKSSIAQETISRIEFTINVP